MESGACGHWLFGSPPEPRCVMRPSRDVTAHSRMLGLTRNVECSGQFYQSCIIELLYYICLLGIPRGAIWKVRISLALPLGTLLHEGMIPHP